MRGRSATAASCSNGRDACLRTSPRWRDDLREKTLEAWVSARDISNSAAAESSPSRTRRAASSIPSSSPRKSRCTGSQAATISAVRKTRAARPRPRKARRFRACRSHVYRADANHRAFFATAQPYGQPWKSPTRKPDPISPQADAHILLGRRDTTRGGRAFLAGEIEEARLYDRALEPAERPRVIPGGSGGGLTHERGSRRTGKDAHTRGDARCREALDP